MSEGFGLLVFATGRQPLKEAKRFECTWDQFVADALDVGFEAVEDRGEDSKTYATQFLAADFVEGAEQKKSDFVERVNLYVLDLDGVPKSKYLKIEQLISDEGLAAFAYTSYSHIDSVRQCKGYRVRVVMPLSRPVPKAEWKRFWSNMRLKFFSCADSTGITAAKPYLMPSIPKKYVGTRSEKITFLREYKGKPIDVDSMLTAYQLDPVVAATRKDRNQPVGGAAVNRFLKEQRGKRSPEAKQVAVALDNANTGEPYAAKGKRDDTMFRMASALGEAFPMCDAEQLASFFKAGIEAQRAADSTDPGPTYEDFVNKLLRAQEHSLVEAERRKQKHEQEKKAAGLGTFSEVIGAYTKESIQSYIEQTGCGASYEDFSHRLILVTHDGFYIFNGNGYSRASKQTFYNACLSHLAHKAKDIGFELYHPATESSPARLKSPTTLTMQYGREVDSLVYRYGTTPHFDERTGTLVLCECSLDTKLEPRAHPQVDAWIDAMAPSPSDAELFRDWLSQAPDTDKALCAIALVGAHGIGKSAFADGMSRLWCANPIAMKTALDNFNYPIVYSPVVFADEKLPDVKGRVPTEEIRSLISSSKFLVNRKYRDESTLHGHLRTIVAINSMASFKLGEAAHSKHDVEAVSRRFLFINTPKTQEDLARDLFDYDYFVTRGALAEHALHLYTTRPRSSLRFGVASQSYDRLVTGDFMSESVLLWIQEQLSRKTGGAAEMKPDTPACFVARGRVYVHARRMFENWGETTNYKPRQATILNALDVVSDEEVRIRIGKRRDTYHIVKTDLLRNFILERKLETPEDIDLMLRISTELPHQEIAFRLTQEQRDERDALLRRYNLGEPVNDNSRAAE
jgi:hypothetical protein